MSSFALVGNPNTGKTSLFNTLTTSYEYVGNWAGVTVEKKIGDLKNGGGQLVDLPGIYSLHPLSRDESVAAQYLMEETPSALINIVDASQLERNLALSIQLLEYGRPIILGLNMMDVAANRGIHVDIHRLQEQLGVPIIPLVARTGKGSSKVLSTLKEIPAAASPELKLDYGAAEAAITDIESLLATTSGLPNHRWVALQLLAQNPVILQALSSKIDMNLVNDISKNCEEQLQQMGLPSSLPDWIRSVRTGFIEKLCSAAMDRSSQKPHNLTERLDNILTHRYFGIPIFLIFMFLLFKVTFDWIGNPLSDVLDGFISGTVSDGINKALDLAGASSFTHALIVDGIVAGVGGVLVFIPQIFILFLIISFIEDSGYMARVSLLMDSLMEAVGLNGKAFIPFIIGFGCNVPAVMSARSIEQPKDRLLTTLLIPLMSCSARLPVYALFAGVFFQSHQALVVLSMYVLGIAMALLLCKVFSSYLLKNESSVFIVELPPYRLPQGRTLMRGTWEKGKGFLRKAGTLILGGSVLIWLLSYSGPGGFGVEMNNSFLAKIGGLMAPLLAPLGFGTWQSGSSLLTGFLAKEIVVSTMNIIYHVPNMEGLQGQIAHSFTSLQAFSFMAFVLLYTPCLATVGVIRKETSSWRWTIFSIGYAVVLAYLISLIIYQGGHLLGLS
ncbi:ferrous iron transport protein B [Paenibacillus sp. J23TS9]|uniref:ferrous iron transport protein B n=1 Tax=Paenibacillus sp. J23TS9 TaxID=2807193 RepID=UPI001B141B57|nr:ferrous iron transport protein B [Paenibacillus sp. J23TS9]GIP29218.1 ferrous iron transport protein B [Paenibacillus sp. J23TS9]